MSRVHWDNCGRAYSCRASSQQGGTRCSCAWPSHCLASRARKDSKESAPGTPAASRGPCWALSYSTYKHIVAMTIFQRTVGEVADDHCVLSGGCSEASARRACKASRRRAPKSSVDAFETRSRLFLPTAMTSQERTRQKVGFAYSIAYAPQSSETCA